MKKRARDKIALISIVAVALLVVLTIKFIDNFKPKDQGYWYDRDPAADAAYAAEIGDMIDRLYQEKSQELYKNMEKFQLLFQFYVETVEQKPPYSVFYKDEENKWAFKSIYGKLNETYFQDDLFEQLVADLFSEYEIDQNVYGRRILLGMVFHSGLVMIICFTLK